MSARTSLFLFCLLGVLLSACAPSKYINVFENESFAQQVSSEAYHQKKDRDSTRCRLEALKIAVPGPDCDFIESCDSINTTIDGEPNVSVKCTTREVCNYRAMDAALAARKETEILCMRLEGWALVQKLNPEWVEWQKNK